MLRFLASRQRRHDLFGPFLRLCGLIAGIALAAAGAAFSAATFISIGLIIHNTLRGGAGSDGIPRWAIVLGIAGLSIGPPLLVIGVRAVRDAVCAMRDRGLDGVDLDKQPWMANAEWRNRRIVHSLAYDPALFGFIFGLPIAIVTSAFVVLTVPTDILATAALISGVIMLLLGHLYRHLKNRKIEITLQNGWVILFLPVVIAIPGALGLFAPAANRVLETVSGVLLIFLFAVFSGYLFRKERKFGISICHLKTLPAFVGASLEVEIEIQFRTLKTGLPELPEGPVEVELQNATAVGRSLVVNWTTQSTIPAHAVARPGDGTLRIPVAVGIPQEARVKIGENWSDSGWNLKIRAPFAGIDYASQFSVPVYLPESAG